MVAVDPIRLEGGRKLRKEMKQAGADMRDLTVMHREVAKVVVRSAKPMSPRGKTGRLMKSVKPGATRTKAEIKAGASPRLPYANPVHWGWPNHMVHPYGNAAVLVPAPIPPNPWVSAQAERTEDIWFGLYVKEFNVILDQCNGLAGA